MQLEAWNGSRRIEEVSSRTWEFGIRISEFGFIQKSAIRNPNFRNLILRSFSLAANLFLDLPMGEQVLVAASRTLPRSLHRIGTAQMEHLNDQVAVQAHGRMAKNFVFFGFRHYWHMKPPVKCFGLRLLTPGIRMPQLWLCNP